MKVVLIKRWCANSLALYVVCFDYCYRDIRTVCLSVGGVALRLKCRSFLLYLEATLVMIVVGPDIITTDNTEPNRCLNGKLKEIEKERRLNLNHWQPLAY